MGEADGAVASFARESRRSRKGPGIYTRTPAVAAVGSEAGSPSTAARKVVAPVPLSRKGPGIQATTPAVAAVGSEAGSPATDARKVVAPVPRSRKDPGIHTRTPAVAAVRSEARSPATAARMPRRARSLLRDGATAPMPAIVMATDPRLA